MEKEQIIGVMGGMGPEATASFFKKLIEQTPVIKDQDHYRIIIDNNPKIPDRTQAILHGGPSPLPEMIKTGHNLTQAGASILVMPCITAHYFYSDINEEMTLPFYHVLKGLDEFLSKTYPTVRKIGVLSTTATRETRLFQESITNKDVCFPDKESQESKVMTAIFGENGIKSGNTGHYPKQLLKEAADELIDAGCELIVGGCTEVELALKPEDICVPFIDPMLVAAQKLTDGALSL
ncbi:MAG: amino acid racemase [Alkalibacterium sp.]|nr:amino acid racemase [Alkalibacterium sp.]TVP90141.1 MAG: amino acid racemase [Alkalibacterium sp.]